MPAKYRNCGVRCKFFARKWLFFPGDVPPLFRYKICWSKMLRIFFTWLRARNFNPPAIVCRTCKFDFAHIFADKHNNEKKKYLPLGRKKWGKRRWVPKKHYSLCLAIVYTSYFIRYSPLVSTLNYYRYHRWVLLKKKTAANDYISTDISNLRRKFAEDKNFALLFPASFSTARRKWIVKINFPGGLIKIIKFM